MKTLLLLGLRLGSVFVEKLEGLASGISVEGIGELGDRRGDLKAEVQNLLLALEADVLWPPVRLFSLFFIQTAVRVILLHHAPQVALRLDILTDAKVSGSLLEERVLVAVSLGH